MIVPLPRSVLRCWAPGILLLLVVGLGACTNPSTDGSEAQTFQLAYGATHVLANGTQLSFAELLAESRCPKSVVCPWAGEAKIGLRLRHAADETSLQATMPGGDRADSTRADTILAMGYAIQLLELDPYPLVPGPREPKDYVAHLRVGKHRD